MIRWTKKIWPIQPSLNFYFNWSGFRANRIPISVRIKSVPHSRPANAIKYRDEMRSDQMRWGEMCQKEKDPNQIQKLSFMMWVRAYFTWTHQNHAMLKIQCSLSLYYPRKFKMVHEKVFGSDNYYSRFGRNIHGPKQVLHNGCVLCVGVSIRGMSNQEMSVCVCTPRWWLCPNSIYKKKKINM